MNFKNLDNLKKLSEPELNFLSDEIREFLLKNISLTGGHIGANLGTIELTIALHSVFNSPSEPILFDTGHQGYTHKLLTGREGLFPTLNTYGGMNRFLTPKESEHDLIEASHAGTAISIGLGISLARKLNGNENPVIAVVGDSALAEGSSLEALNHAVVENTNLIVVINDNGYAISEGFGGIHEILQDKNGRAKRFFSEFGMDYFGPVDGHNISQLKDVFSNAKNSKKMPIVHAKTIKGNSWKPADNHPYRMHFSFPFDIKTGKSVGNNIVQNTYPDVAAKTLKEAMEENEKITCITPSTLYATGLTSIFNSYPDRCFDPGMEEQHALSMTVGLALGGYIPVIAYQATFLQRAFDQLLHDVCFSNLPTLILSMRSGFSGYDNPTHHGIYDISYLRPFPNLTILYPKDSQELEIMIKDSLENIKSPIMIMMPYGPIKHFGSTKTSDITRPELVLVGKDTLIITVGNKFEESKEAAIRTNSGLMNIRCLKPLKDNELVEIFLDYKKIVVVEEAVLDGGIGSCISSLITDRNINIEVLRLGIPCKFVEPGSNEELSEKYNLNSDGICNAIKNRWPS